MSGLIVLVLVCPLLGVVEPGVGESIRQRAFSLTDEVDEAAEVIAAQRTCGYGAGRAKGDLLTTLALDGDASRMPLVGYAERDFAALIVRLDALDDLLRHGLLPLPSRKNQRVIPAWRQVGRRGSYPRSRRGGR
jgi:hypothetical protein